jgi:hypothetical protein
LHIPPTKKPMEGLSLIDFGIILAF